MLTKNIKLQIYLFLFFVCFAAQSIALASRLQLELPEEDSREQLSEYRKGHDIILTTDNKVLLRLMIHGATC